MSKRAASMTARAISSPREKRAVTRRVFEGKLMKYCIILVYDGPFRISAVLKSPSIGADGPIEPGQVDAQEGFDAIDTYHSLRWGRLAAVAGFARSPPEALHPPRPRAEPVADGVRSWRSAP